jgi:hypothetical protein
VESGKRKDCPELLGTLAFGKKNSAAVVVAKFWAPHNYLHIKV